MKTYHRIMRLNGAKTRENQTDLHECLGVVTGPSLILSTFRKPSNPWERRDRRDPAIKGQGRNGQIMAGEGLTSYQYHP